MDDERNHSEHEESGVDAGRALEVRAAAMKARARGYLETLKERNRQVLEYKFGFFDGREHTLQETGDFFGISRQRVHQILQQLKADASTYTPEK